MRITSTGIACFSCTVCAPTAIFTGCVGIGQTSPAFGLEVYSSRQTAITSDNTFGANFNVIFNRDNTGGTRNCFNLLADQNAAYLRTLDNFPMVFVTAGSDRARIAANGIACFACQICTPQVIQSQSQGKTLTLIRSVDVEPSTTGYMSIDVDPYVAGTYRLLLDMSAAAYGNSTDGPGVFKISFGGYYSTAGNGLAGIYVNCMTNGSWGWNRSGNIYCIAVTNTGSQAKFVVGRFDLTWA
jgi:hypothetical protein